MGPCYSGCRIYVDFHGLASNYSIHQNYVQISRFSPLENHVLLTYNLFSWEIDVISRCFCEGMV